MGVILLPQSSGRDSRTRIIMIIVVAVVVSSGVDGEGGGV